MWGWPPVPWRRVISVDLYAGPRNGLRVMITFECGHTMDRMLQPKEKADPGASITQCAGRCYSCWWRVGGGVGGRRDQVHFSSGSGPTLGIPEVPHIPQGIN